MRGGWGGYHHNLSTLYKISKQDCSWMSQTPPTCHKSIFITKKQASMHNCASQVLLFHSYWLWIVPGRSIDGQILAMSFSILPVERGFLKTLHLEVTNHANWVNENHEKSWKSSMIIIDLCVIYFSIYLDLYHWKRLPMKLLHFVVTHFPRALLLLVNMGGWL